MNKHLYYISTLLLLFWITEPYAAPSITLFTRLTNPTGLAVDHLGQIYVQSLSGLGDGGLYKYDSTGGLLARNSQLNGKYRLAADAINGVIWAQELSGMLYVIDPLTLQAQALLNLRTAAINTEPVLNLTTGKRIPLIMANPIFGDIAVHTIDTHRFDLFITGQTASGGGIPFVLRLHIENGTLQSMKIIAASIPYPTPIIPPPLDKQAFGIAVNDNGTVLTVFPTDIIGGITPLILASFGADYPETGVNAPQFLADYLNKPIHAIGMTSISGHDHFYIASVANGVQCGAGPAILLLSLSPAEVRCLADLSGLGLGNVSPADLAIDPNQRTAYVSMTQLGQVWRIELPAAPVPVPVLNFTLNVSRQGTGTGAVDSTPAGIVCGTVCSEAFPKGTTVTLNATPAQGSTFTAWSGACSGAGACRVTLDQVTSIGAIFTANPPSQSGLAPTGRSSYSLTVASSGDGNGTVSSTPSGIRCGTRCTKSFRAGVTVKLDAKAAAYSVFVGWTGACSGTGRCRVSIGQDQAVTADFELKRYTLAVRRVGAGTVRSASGDEIDCGSRCDQTYRTGTKVILQAEPIDGGHFRKWRQDCAAAGKKSVCKLTMNKRRAVTATFD